MNPHAELADQPLVVENLARICHEANRAYCKTIGDDSHNDWDNAAEWQKESARMGVRMHLTGDHGPEASHQSWLLQKESEGWEYGPHKDPTNKRHPCMVPFKELSDEQRFKDYIFCSIVTAAKLFRKDMSK